MRRWELTGPDTFRWGNQGTESQGDCPHVSPKKSDFKTDRVVYTPLDHFGKGGGSMASARESILCFKHDIPAMQKDGGLSKMLLADALFENFVEYASANWDYIAEASNLSADALLASADHNRVDCAKLREALKKMFEQDLGLEGVSNATLDSSNKCGHFITKPDFHCFDPKVNGNVGNQG